MGIGNKKILSEVRKVRQVSSFRNSLLRFPARGKSQPIRYLGLFRLLCVSGAFSLAPKRTLDLHLAYFSETLYSASPQTNKKKVCRNARCTSFLFITIQICSFSLSCDLLKISLIYVFPASKNSSCKLIKQSNQPVHTFFCQFCTHLFYIEGNG